MARVSGTGVTSPSNVLRHLKGISFPCGKNDIMQMAESTQAPQEVRNILQQLPDQKFYGPQDIMHELGRTVY